MAAVNDVTEPSALPDFLNHDRPPVPDLVVPRGVLPFHLEGRPVRGRLVRLGPLANALIGRHDLPEAVAALLGQALALTAGLAAALKFRGSFSLQAKGDGPVAMLLADCTDAGALRGHVRAEGAPTGDAAALLGRGHLAFTCDQGADMDRYQGIVAMDGATLADMTARYFETSEQMAATVRLACARAPGQGAGWRAAALILERVAGAGGIGEELTEEEAAEAWTTATVLAGTVTDAELLDDSLPAERLLHRLFHAEELVVDPSRALSYGCRCSRARLAGVLQGFPEGDLDEMAEDGAITMTCEFCNVGFRFDRAEVRGAAGRA